MIDREIYHINSNLRLNPDSETSSNFTYSIQKPPESVFDRVTLMKISIPKTYYNVDNSFSFVLDENGSQATITLTSANYTRRAFATRLQAALNTYTPTSWVYTVTYDNTTITGDRGYWIFGVSGNLGVQPEFIFTQNSKALEILGFNQYTNGILDLTKQFAADALTSEIVPNLQAEQTLFIRSNICQNYSNDILGTAFVDSSDFSSVVFECADIIGYSRSLSHFDSDVYYFKITDENGSIIDLNGVNVNFELILFKEANIYGILLAQLQLLTAKEMNKAESQWYDPYNN